MSDDSNQFFIEMNGKDINKIATIRLQNKILNADGKHYENNRNEKFFYITDKKIAELIFDTYGNPLNRQILEYASIPHTIMEISSNCIGSQTTSYRRILKLIENGFLIPLDVGKKWKGKKSIRFVSTCTNVYLHVSVGSLMVLIQFQNFLQ
ncbi:hypothetical protein NSIN_20412 [Nitrosotalea sinensis]|uniref:Uncharacterized protein n=1 Tax=Nitrosotalea sinensis TaxID=1499975 RepID=A0A2H1EG50_9ARCH|nr:hypothetical protein [Candidatus Nitrosotalea sinensis]SHO44701.1 hypothetical protein NSIN_20412 [Candidatus Nitrosotalea sinensis]